MYIIGCDFHTRFQQLAVMNCETGEVTDLRLSHEGDDIKNYYESLEKPVRVGIESTGYSLWFDQLLSQLGVELLVGDAGAIASRRVKRCKYDRVDARLILQLLVRGEFPTIYLPSIEVRNHRTLLSHRHRLVRMRTRIKNGLHAIALSHRKVLGSSLFSRKGQQQLAGLQLPSYMARQRQDCLALLKQLDEWIDQLDKEIENVVVQYPEAKRLMTHPGVGSQTALAMVLVVGPIERFAKGRQLASYLGLVPSEHSSGGHQRFGKITKQGNRHLRYLMIQSANWVRRLDPELARMYSRIQYRKGKQRAIVAVARKLTIRLYIMLKEKIDYTEFCARGGTCEPASDRPTV